MSVAVEKTEDSTVDLMEIGPGDIFVVPGIKDCGGELIKCTYDIGGFRLLDGGMVPPELLEVFGDDCYKVQTLDEEV